jgi:hypothetical protein
MGAAGGGLGEGGLEEPLENGFEFRFDVVVFGHKPVVSNQ